MSQPYLVSARKYRPQTFESVVGQSHITTTLKNAIKSDQIAHAYLFFGPRGVGKTTCARILAKTINCETPTEDLEACGTCSTCLAFEDNANMNIFELDAASHNSVDDIRSLNEQVRFVPQQGKYKIYIIDEVHMLSTSAFNAFLKTLEEPPPYAIFILATTEKHKVLPTILSRCQIFDFKRIQIKDIAKHLASICEKEGIQYDMNALHLIAQKAEGGMRDALSIMDRISSFSNQNISYEAVIEHLNILDAAVYFQWTDAFLKQDFGEALLILDKHLQLGFEGDMIISGLADHFRNLLLSQDGRLLQLIDLPEEFKQQYFQQAQLINEIFLVNALSIINKAELDYKVTLNKKLLLEVTLIKLAHLNDLYKVTPSIEEGKKKISDPNPPQAKETQQSAPKQLPTPKQEVSAATTSSSPKAETGISQNVAGEAPETKERPTNYTHSIPPEPGAKTSKKEVKSTEIKAEKTKTPPPLRTNNTPPGLKKRSSQLLEELHSNNANQEVVEEVTLTQELVMELMEEYKAILMKTPEKQPFVTQLEMMDINLLNPDLIQFVSFSKISESYAEVAADEFREFVRNKSSNKQVRVITHLNLTEKREMVIEMPKTKLEIFQEIVADFPYIGVLKSKYRFDVE